MFASNILVAPFVHMATLVVTYRAAGFIPILSPLARFPLLFNYLSTFIQEKWLSKDRIAEYIRANEAIGEKDQLTLIHAEYDYDLPWHHTEVLFWHAVSATVPQVITYDELDEVKCKSKSDLGAAGSVMEWRTEKNVIREESLKTGLHNVVMGNPATTMAIMRIFEAADSSFNDAKEEKVYSR